MPTNFTSGQLVFVWCQPRVGTGRWHGPGVIVLDTLGGSWVNMRGSLWRVSHEQMRSATNEESQGIEIVNQFLGQMAQELRRGGRGASTEIDEIDRMHGIDTLNK